MKFFDYIRFGLKNIWRQKARTLLTIFAVMIGATSVVAMLTIVLTAKTVVIGSVEKAGALTQVTVSANTEIEGEDVFNTSGGGSSDSAVKLNDDTVKKVATIPHVTSAVPMLGSWNLRSATLKDDASKKVNFDQVVGIEPSSAADQEVAAGRNLQKSDKRAVVMGTRYLEKLGYKGNPAGVVGKTLVFSVKGYMGVGSDIPKPPLTNNREDGESYQKSLQERVTTFEAEIVGVLASPMFDNQVLIPMSWSRELMVNQRWDMEQQDMQFDRNGRPISSEPKWKLVSEDFFANQGYSVIVVKVDQIANVDTVATAVKDMKLGAATAQDMIKEMTRLFNILGMVLGAVGAISLFVAAVGVINTMVMATLERTREIGVLRACGARRSTVRRLFTFEASLLGLWGGVAGVAVAYGLVALARHFGGDALNAQGIDAAVAQIPLWLALVTIVVTTVIGMLAGYFPAIRASRLDPVEALRYE